MNASYVHVCAWALGCYSVTEPFGGGRWPRRWTAARRQRVPFQWCNQTCTAFQGPGGPRHCVATSVPRICCFNCCAVQSHKDNVRSTAVEEQLEAKGRATFLSSEPITSSLLLISPGLNWESSSSPSSWSLLDLVESPAHLPPLDLSWA